MALCGTLLLCLWVPTLSDKLPHHPVIAIMSFFHIHDLVIWHQSDQIDSNH